MSSTPKVKKVVKKVKKNEDTLKDTNVEPLTVSEPSVSASESDTTTVSTSSVVANSNDSPSDVLQEISASFKDLVSTLTAVQTQARSAVSAVRAVERLVTKRVKEANKKRGRKNKDPNKAKRAPSGFAKPSLISDELCVFLGKPSNTFMARTEVTKHLTKYIKDNNLQDPLNKRKIVPDEVLKKVLNVSDEDDVTYFNLQKHMKHHFPKSNSNVSVSSS